MCVTRDPFTASPSTMVACLRVCLELTTFKVLRDIRISCACRLSAVTPRFRSCAYQSLLYHVQCVPLNFVRLYCQNDWICKRTLHDQIGIVTCIRVFFSRRNSSVFFQPVTGSFLDQERLPRERRDNSSWLGTVDFYRLS